MLKNLTQFDAFENAFLTLEYGIQKQYCFTSSNKNKHFTFILGLYWSTFCFHSMLSKSEFPFFSIY